MSNHPHHVDRLFATTFYANTSRFCLNYLLSVATTWNIPLLKFTTLLCSALALSGCPSYQLYEPNDGYILRYAPQDIADENFDHRLARMDFSFKIRQAIQQTLGSATISSPSTSWRNLTAQDKAYEVLGGEYYVDSPSKPDELIEAYQAEYDWQNQRVLVRYWCEWPIDADPRTTDFYIAVTMHNSKTNIRTENSQVEEILAYLIINHLHQIGELPN